VHGASDRLGAARGGPLEHQVLDQMRHAATVIGLVTRPGLDPHADGDRAHVLHALRHDPDAVGQEALPVAFRHALTFRPAAGWPPSGSSAFPCRPGLVAPAWPFCGSATFSHCLLSLSSY